MTIFALLLITLNRVSLICGLVVRGSEFFIPLFIFRIMEFEDICSEMCKLHAAKNEAYGNSFEMLYKRLGVIYAAPRIFEKANRLLTLAENGNINDLGESIDDTLIDIANYAVMTLVERNKYKK